MGTASSSPAWRNRSIRRPPRAGRSLASSRSGPSSSRIRFRNGSARRCPNVTPAGDGDSAGVPSSKSYEKDVLSARGSNRTYRRRGSSGAKSVWSGPDGPGANMTNPHCATITVNLSSGESMLPESFRVNRPCKAIARPIGRRGFTEPEPMPRSSTVSPWRGPGSPRAAAARTRGRRWPPGRLASRRPPSGTRRPSSRTASGPAA